MQEHINRFIRYLEVERGVSAHTVRAYRSLEREIGGGKKEGFDFEGLAQAAMPSGGFRSG